MTLCSSTDDRSCLVLKKATSADAITTAAFQWTAPSRQISYCTVRIGDIISVAGIQN
jgi:hypothetical protein